MRRTVKLSRFERWLEHPLREDSKLQSGGGTWPSLQDTEVNLGGISVTFLLYCSILARPVVVGSTRRLDVLGISFSV